MKPIEVKNPFVETRNVKNFGVMMDGLALAEGEGRFGIVYGQAGLGKSRTVQRWYANNADSVYIRTQKVWESTYTGFLQALCRELDVKPVPHWKSKCFASIADALIQHPRAMFIDEIERLPSGFLEVVRDITDITGCPVILVGEEELFSYMRQNRRVWSRTFQQTEFRAIGASDIMLYFKMAINIRTEPDMAAMVHGLSAGNFRDVRRIVLNLAQICNAKKTTEITSEMIQVAYKTGLNGGAR